MKKASLAVAVGLFLLMYACVFAQVEMPIGEMAAPNRGLIKGKVTDTQTPRPNNLPDATVTVQGELIDGSRDVVTDAAGNYEVTGLPPGEYVVTVIRSGYSRRRPTISYRELSRPSPR